MYENLGSQFYKTITKIQSRSDALDNPWAVINFLTILGVSEI